MQKTLIIIGLAVLAIGVLWPWLSQLPLGRLPGDINIERGGARFSFPIVTCLILSVLLSILLRLFAGR